MIAEREPRISNNYSVGRYVTPYPTNRRFHSRPIPNAWVPKFCRRIVAAFDACQMDRTWSARRRKLERNSASDVPRGALD